MQVKHSNWFAAGPEVSRALLLLSDGAFRLYFYFCLHANRDSGNLAVSLSDVANALARSRRSIATYSEELRSQGVCKIRPAVNQHQLSEIEICDEFWPYTKADSGLNPPQVVSYIAKIRSLLDTRECVECTFTAADQKLAASLMVQDVPLELVERAIALGCSRKYVSLLNETDAALIYSFAYFRDLIDEANDQETPAGYWDFQKLQLKSLEDKWIAKKSSADAKSASAEEPKNK